MINTTGWCQLSLLLSQPLDKSQIFVVWPFKTKANQNVRIHLNMWCAGRGIKMLHCLRKVGHLITLLVTSNDKSLSSPESSLCLHIKLVWNFLHSPALHTDTQSLKGNTSSHWPFYIETAQYWCNEDPSLCCFSLFRLHKAKVSYCAILYGKSPFCDRYRRDEQHSSRVQCDVFRCMTTITIIDCSS